MRTVIALFLALFASPALAEYWTPYANGLFGYELDIPPYYESYIDSADGNGAIFMRPGRLQELTFWAEDADAGLEALAEERKNADISGGWAISYQASTPDWATWTGQRGDQVVYQRMILLCDHTSVAAYRSVYPVKDLPEMHAIIEGINRSFRASGC